MSFAEILYFCKDNDRIVKFMGIKRNEVADPEWDKWDYAVISKEDLFSKKRWKETVNWDIILKQAEKTRQASQMIDIRLYPSTLFFAAVDMLEANLYVIDDLFYCLTGMRMMTTKVMSEELKNKLGFWNMDCYKVLEQIENELEQSHKTLKECLNHEAIWDVTIKALGKKPFPKIEDTFSLVLYNEEKSAFQYAREHYAAEKIDKEALARQIANIIRRTIHYIGIFHYIYANSYHFPQLLALFRASEIAQRKYIEPWRHDFGGTRDSLIAKMEKDTELGPWVHRYDHLALDNHVPFWLLSGTKNFNGSVDKEAYLNTDNWLSILTIAAVLQEYDELHQAESEADEDCDEDILLKLELYFKDEASTQRFLKSVKDMNDTEIITLVKKYWQAGLCTDASKNLWRVLYEANLYKATYANWNKQVVIRKK